MSLTDNSIMPYGKHKGEKLANVPDSYWEYMLREGKLTPDLMQYAKNNQDVFEANKKRNR